MPWQKYTARGIPRILSKFVLVYKAKGDVIKYHGNSSSSVHWFRRIFVVEPKCLNTCTWDGTLFATIDLLELGWFCFGCETSLLYFMLRNNFHQENMSVQYIPH